MTIERGWKFPYVFFTAPEAASTTARAWLLAPFTAKKSPPSRTLLPSGVTSIARPDSSALAVKGLSAPEVASTAANRWRGRPSTVPKSPAA